MAEEQQAKAERQEDDYLYICPWSWGGGGGWNEVSEFKTLWSQGRVSSLFPGFLPQAHDQVSLILLETSEQSCGFL